MSFLVIILFSPEKSGVKTAAPDVLIPIYSYYNGCWNIVTRYATLYKDKEGVWKVRLNNVDYIVQTGRNFYGRTQYIYIGMGYYYYL